jgi:hypothetical protein
VYIENSGERNTEITFYTKLPRLDYMEMEHNFYINFNRF